MLELFFLEPPLPILYSTCGELRKERKGNGKVRQEWNEVHMTRDIELPPPLPHQFQATTFDFPSSIN